MNTLFIRADATTDIGTGHIMRCIALGQAWQDRGKVVFISHCESVALKKRFTDEGFDFILLDKPHPDPFDLEYTLNTLHKLSAQHKALSTWLVVDGYHFDSAYQKSIKEAGHKLLWIDDYGHADHYWADIVLNQNISACESFYNNRETYTRLLLGTQYVLLRREFWPWRGWKRDIAPVARKVLITMGGSDPENVTLKVLHALIEMNEPNLEIKVIMGPVNPHRESINEVIRQLPFQAQCLDTVSNMPTLMVWADVAIAAGGSTCWELSFMGLPTAVIVIADNQRLVSQLLEENGVILNLGEGKSIQKKEIANLINKLCLNQALREEFSEHGSDLVDGYGLDKIKSHIL